jgi:hypothetical protein
MKTGCMKRVLSPCFVPRAVYKHMSGECPLIDCGAEAGREAAPDAEASSLCQDQYLCGTRMYSGQTCGSCLTCPAMGDIGNLSAAQLLNVYSFVHFLQYVRASSLWGRL